MTVFDRRNLSESTSLQSSTQESSWKKKCCHPGNSDGFTVISSCFFVFTVAVTGSLIIQINYGNYEVTPHGAVATDDQSCSEIGIHAIRDGGSAVDATVASLLCLSVTQPHLVGPGGGGVMLIHDHQQNKTKIYDFMAAFTSNETVIGVPGFLKGLETAHNEFGKLPWKKLFDPAIKLARNGFMTSGQLVEALSAIDVSLFSPNLQKVFFPKGISVKEGQILYRKKYARLLEDISVGGADELHLLKYGTEMLEAFVATGSSITNVDLQNYAVIERDVVKERIFNVTLLTAGPPFGGLQVVAGLELMDELGVNSQIPPTKLFDAFAEALLFGTALTKTKFAPGSDYLNETSSLYKMFTSNGIALGDLPPPTVAKSPSSQVSAIDTFDLYVASVVGLGNPFGSRYMTEHGIILNRYSEPFSESNSLYDGRRLNSFTPLVASDTNNICGDRIVLSSGSWGAMLQTCCQMIFRNLDMTSAIAEPRIALGKDPKVLLLNDFNQQVSKLPSNVREHLKTRSFKLKGLFTPLGVNGVSKYKDLIVSHSDTIGGGVAARLEREVNTKDESEELNSNSSNL